ncbi:ABC transporter permease [Pendulispora brunnea]|uniref:ABC transporter permease n=1 Tax=Pendulispora brunnea TaxID=2905690 RepID=A0ABZ2JU77_9BACT
MWLETWFMALRALRRNTMRSALTMLGIVIGVGSVIAMVTLGRGATALVTQEVASLGTNMLIVSPGAMRRGPVSGTARSFDLDDVRALSREVPGLTGIAPVTNASVLAMHGSANFNTTANGTTNDYFRVRNLRILSGRDFSESELDAGIPVCVLGETVRRQLFGPANPIGDTIRLGTVTCNVIGLLEPKGRSTFGHDQDDLLILPIRAVQRRLTGNSYIGTIFATVADEASIHRAKDTLRAVLRERRRTRVQEEDDFSLDDTREIAKSAGNVTQTLTAFLAAVAAVSLLVGGIGIMNIMLVSVTERTREIGTRLAIGALGRDVLLQFLVEAIFLCALGGVAGVALGLGGSYAASRMLRMPFAIDVPLVVAAFGFSAGLGVVFGFLPARKAARLHPIEALRHE